MASYNTRPVGNVGGINLDHIKNRNFDNIQRKNDKKRREVLKTMLLTHNYRSITRKG